MNRTSLLSRKGIKDTDIEAVNIYTAGAKELCTNTKPDAVNGPVTAATYKKTVPPWYQNEYVLSHKEATMYTQAKSVYLRPTEKKKREYRFFEKLQKILQEEGERSNKMMHEKDLNRREAKQRQLKQLRKVRNKWEKLRHKRWAGQYISSKTVEKQLQSGTRGEYGLPDENTPMKSSESDENQKNNNRSSTLAYKKFVEVSNKVRSMNTFGKMFKVHVGPTWNPKHKDPKMPRRDVVVLEITDSEGNIVKKKLDMKKELTEINAMFETSDSPQGITRVQSELSKSMASLDISNSYSDDEDDDIYARLSKKYGLEIDGDDDDKDT